MNMGIINIMCIAIGLAMDAVAVSIANGIIIKKNKISHAVMFGLCFGFFQFFMPVIGWAYGTQFTQNVSHIAHWIAFSILAFIGGKMICEATVIEPLEESKGSVSVYALLGLSVATSIDALAVGGTFALLNIRILAPAFIIGIVTLCMSCTGFLIAARYGHIFEKKIEIAGGMILILIGAKIVIEHL